MAPFSKFTSATFAAPSTGDFMLSFVVSAEPNVIGGVDSTLLLDNVSITAVPEPASMSLIGLGAVVFAAIRRRKARATQSMELR